MIGDFPYGSLYTSREGLDWVGFSGVKLPSKEVPRDPCLGFVILGYKSWGWFNTVGSSLMHFVFINLGDHGEP